MRMKEFLAKGLKKTLKLKKNRNIENYEITAETAKQMLRLDKNIILVDVRSKNEYDEGHINGAISIPNYELLNKLYLLNSIDSTIIVYCQKGGRSKKAVKELRQIGYINSYSVIDGLTQW